MSLHWGRELIAIYNDARARIIGPRHPGALGRSALDQFPERRELHEPLFARVQNGEAFTLTDTWIPILRDGGLTEACFTVSFSPVRDDRGDVGGVLAVLIETTKRVRAEAAVRVSEARQRFLLSLHDRLRSISDPETIQYEAARLLGEHLGASRVGYAEIEPDGLHSVVTRNYTNGVRGIEGRYRVADFSPALLPALRAGRTVARTDVARDTELSEAEKSAHAALQVGATVDVPLVKEDRLVAVLFMHHRDAHAWTADELALLEAVAERTWEAVERARAEARLRAGEARLQRPRHRRAGDVGDRPGYGRGNARCSRRGDRRPRARQHWRRRPRAGGPRAPRRPRAAAERGRGRRRRASAVRPDVPRPSERSRATRGLSRSRACRRRRSSAAAGRDESRRDR
jgi:PAS domain-containing protein